jgi:hypothetical protein
LNHENLANLLLAKQEGKKFQCRGYKTLLLGKKKRKRKKGTKVTTFLRKEIQHCGDRKENTVQKGIKYIYIYIWKNCTKLAHILRKEILKPPYLDSRLLRKVAKTKQDSKKIKIKFYFHL